MEFLPLSRRRSSARNVPSGEERGETDLFAGYSLFDASLQVQGWETSASKHVYNFNRDLKHRRLNGTTTPTGACARLSKRRPAFVDDEIQEGLPLSLKPKYKIVLLRANPSSSPLSFSKSRNIFFVD